MNNAQLSSVLLLEYGYSQEYIDIFFKYENNKWGYTSGRASK